MAGKVFGRLALLAGAMALAGCEGGFALPGTGDKEATEAPVAQTSVRLVERDVEAPEVFQVAEQGLWDGRPSLGGVWVAYAEVKEPERVIIRNPGNGKFVIGALFRREREMPGPALQVSSDAAAALGLLAGAPARLNVTALRSEEVPVAPPAPDTPAPTPAAPAPAATAATARPVAEVTGTAAAAITAAEAKTAPPPAATPATQPEPGQKPATRPAPTNARPYLQIGIFSVEANAERAAGMLRKQGVVPLIRTQESQGKPFWRVIVGPANRSADRDILLEKVRGLGFQDAYFVRN